MNETTWQPSDRKRNRAKTSLGVLILIVLILVLIALVVFDGILGRRQIFVELKKTTQQEAIPQVSVISPQQSPKTRPLNLPGNVAAWYEAPIYGQVSGYVSKWYTDYGAIVHRNQVLATIDTPDLDEQMDQAQADLAVANARYKLAKLTASRWRGLAGTQAVSQQQVDVYQGDAEAQAAQVMAQEHNVKRYEARESFKTLRAPFDGIVTARRTDIGDYVGAGGGTERGAGQVTGQSELFRVADVHEMRLFVDVPQDYAGYMKEGVTADFSIQQHPGRIYHATFLTTAKAVSADSRTVVTELTADNSDRSLWPGSYASVHFSIPTDPNVLTVPSSSVLFRSQGLLIFLLGPDNKVHIQKVTAGLDMGDRMQILAGLKKDDRIIESPSEGLLEGEVVQVAPEKVPSGQNKGDAQLSKNQ